MIYNCSCVMKRVRDLFVRQKVEKNGGGNESEKLITQMHMRTELAQRVFAMAASFFDPEELKRLLQLEKSQRGYGVELESFFQKALLENFAVGTELVCVIRSGHTFSYVLDGVSGKEGKDNKYRAHCLGDNLGFMPLNGEIAFFGNPSNAVIFSRTNDGSFSMPRITIMSIHKNIAWEKIGQLFLQLEMAHRGVMPWSMLDDMPKGSFEVCDELKTLKQEPDRNKQKEALRLAKERKKEQMDDLYLLPQLTRDYVRTHPDALYLEVIDAVIGPHPERFSKAQRIEIKQRIVRYLFQIDQLAYYARTLSAEKFVETVLHIPMSQLEYVPRIRYNSFAVEVIVETKKDFERIVRESGMDAERIGGIAKMGGINIIAGYQVLFSVVTHEDRHQENKFMLPSQSTTITHAQDEIIAYLADGSSKEFIVNALTKRNGVYDYFKNEREAAGRANDQERVAALETEWNTHCRRVTKAVEYAFEVGVSHLEKLTITPIAFWRGLAAEQRAEKSETSN